MKTPELIYTWAELKAVQDRMEEAKAEAEAITELIIREKRDKTEEERLRYNALWDEYRELDEKHIIMRKQVIPEVGMPCTVIYYSDRSAGYVAEVINPKTIVVQQDGLYDGRKTYTYRSNGKWIQKGTTIKDWGTICHLGYRSNYYDPEY